MGIPLYIYIPIIFHQILYFPSGKKNRKKIFFENFSISKINIISVKGDQVLTRGMVFGKGETRRIFIWWTPTRTVVEAGLVVE